MDAAEAELEKRSKFLNSLLLQKKKNEQAHDQNQHHDHMNVRVRASDMPLPLQNHAFKTAREIIDDSKSSKSTKVDSKRLALALKKVC